MAILLQCTSEINKVCSDLEHFATDISALTMQSQPLFHILDQLFLDYYGGKVVFIIIFLQFYIFVIFFYSFCFFIL